MANFRGCWPEEKVCGQKHIFGQFEKIDSNNILCQLTIPKLPKIWIFFN